MPSPDTDRTARIFAALGEPTRLALVARLRHGRRCSIADLTHGLSLSRQGITKHLRVLERAGLVRSARSGRENRFELVPESLEVADNYLQQIAADWDEALRRLKSRLES